ncbi:MAG TPA: DegT/DnrJ/EryC1/StrS family aminotransferase [Rhodospirillales bacterium]
MTRIDYPLGGDTWDDRELAAIKAVMDSGKFTMGPRVREFETRFAEHFGARHAVMTNSGSSANLIGVMACLYHPRHRLSPGDEVIVPAISWSTTYFPVHQAGLKLRFVDVDPKTLNLDADQVRRAITPKTRAVFAVNLLGNPNDFDGLRRVADDSGLLLLEDNCEGMGARFGGRHTGTFGLFGTFSTYFSHHISTMEGGVVITDDEDLYHILLSLRSHGWVREQPAHSKLRTKIDPFIEMYRFVLPGYNVRPLEISGAIGVEQLQKLPQIVDQRRANAAAFKNLFGDFAHVRIQRETGESSWFAFAMTLTGELAGRRAAVVDAFTRNGVECRPIVAGNFVNNPVMAHLDHSVSGSLGAADDIDANGLYLGNHPRDIRPQLAAVRDILDGVASGRNA